MDRKEYMKEYYQLNKEKKKEYQQNNKDQIAEQKKVYRENNKEQIKEYKKEWYENNKQKICEQKKVYNETEDGKKLNRINNWKQRGVISEDFDALYEYYLKIINCENCDVELVEGNVAANRRVLDHSHTTGLFRNVLCNSCNIIRK